MQSVSIRVLLVANHEQEHTRVAELLSQASTQTFTLASASTYEQGLAAILAGSCDVCLVLGGEPSRLDLLAEAAAKPDHPQIILLTAEGNLAVDLPAAKAGAADHLIEGELTPALLERSILYALERGRAQKALRDAGESQSLSLAKTAFLATMSHEMRTPMNSILGMADTLWESPLNHEQTRCVEVLRRNASGLLRSSTTFSTCRLSSRAA